MNSPTEGIEDRPTRRGKRKKDPFKPTHPLQAGIYSYIRKLPESTISSTGMTLEELVAILPKRYSIYPPLLLLPANVFRFPPAWETVYSQLDAEQRQALYASIAHVFARMGVSHIATNAPISPKGSTGHENRMRSPTGFYPLYGDFGPPASAASGEEEGGLISRPSDAMLDAAFWIRAVQNNGVVQIWAPQHTMFSRGNITEKARIMGQGTTFDGLDKDNLGERLENIGMVDMYAGIGYFVFSYLKRGVGRVWGWEINGWSIEGLRRGCHQNGWGAKIVRVGSDGNLEGTDSESLADELRDEHRVVVFHGDNRFASAVMEGMKQALEKKKAWKRVRHINLGLLPTSKPSWKGAVEILDPTMGGYVHVHENVGVQEIEHKKDTIVEEFRSLISHKNQEQSADLPASRISCEHVEKVKTYAPGVIHCVYDISIPRL